MGCNGSKSVATVLASADAETNADSTVSDRQAPDASVTRPVTPQPLQPVPPSMAFDIPFDDDADDANVSIVKKHPPRRLQRLEEQQQQQAPLSLQELQEKQQEAENRRLQFLQLRAQSAKRKYAIRNNDKSTGSQKSSQNSSPNHSSKLKLDEYPDTEENESQKHTVPDNNN